MKTLGKLLFLLVSFVVEGCKYYWYTVKKWFMMGYYDK